MFFARAVWEKTNLPQYINLTRLHRHSSVSEQQFSSDVHQVHMYVHTRSIHTYRYIHLHIHIHTNMCKITGNNSEQKRVIPRHVWDQACALHAPFTRACLQARNPCEFRSWQLHRVRAIVQMAVFLCSQALYHGNRSWTVGLYTYHVRTTYTF